MKNKTIIAIILTVSMCLSIVCPVMAAEDFSPTEQVAADDKYDTSKLVEIEESENNEKLEAEEVKDRNQESNTEASSFEDRGTDAGNITWDISEQNGIKTLIISGSGNMANDCNEIWGTDYDRVVIENGITSIGRSAFAYSNIESIEIADSVSFIDEYAFSNCTRLTSIQIPYGVSVLSWGLFEDCTSLSNVILPNTIIRTEYEVFCGCTSLKHITLPDSLRIIEHGVFMGSGLESIIIPQNCETIQVAAFSDCTNLASVELKEGVTSLLNGCFSGCTMLSEIEIPSTVTNIGESVFGGDVGLESILFKGNAPALSEKAFYGITTTVYYPDNDDSWTDVVDLDYGGDITWIPGNPNGGTDFAPVEPANITSTFNFRSGLKNDNSIEYTFNYNDNWVFSENSNNRYKLMQTSIRVAMAAFGTKEDRDYGERNIKKMMSRMGFKYTNDSIDYPNPQEDTIGSAIGLKNIRNSDGSTRSIILVALRGGGYGKEWAGDFRVGSNNKAYHEGFGLAAADVEARLAFFINSNRQYISDDLRIWITGFSRAAATSNIVAADLIDGYMAGQGVEPNEVLAYCFECPQTVINANAHSQKYSNINNIVNPIDFVPKVPFKNWYFTRYGNTYYIPCKETTKSFEKKYKRQMIQKYQDLCEYNEILLTDDRVTEVTGQASALDGFFDHLSFWINRKKYYKDHETSFMDLTGSLLGGSGTPDWGAAFPTLVNVLGVSSLIPARTALVVDMFWDHNNGPGPSAHFPELCLSWIDSLGEYSRYKTSEDSIYRRIFINCPVDAVVRDSEGTVVGCIENDEAVEIEDGIVTSIDEDGQKVFILPQDEEYTIEITATDDGEVNYTVEEYNFDTSTAEKIINYKNIEVTTGDSLTGTASELPENEEAEYTLQKEDEEETLIPDEVLSGDEVVKYAVDVSYEGEGTVSGGGPYFNGEFTKVTAEPAEGFVFAGWFIDDSCVSTETEYRFAVTEDVQLVAKFTQDQSIQLDKSEMTVKTGREYKLTATFSPDSGQQINWESSDPAVATVNQDGIVTGLKSGTATVTANVEDSGISASCAVTVIGGSWKKDNTGWWYLWEDVSYPKSEFLVIEGVTYYFNPSGYMVTGWRSIDGKWYYFNASGAMMTGWQKLGGVWYYMNSNGAMVTGWQSIDGVWYYFNNSGAMQTGWRQLGGVWYYMNPSGAMVTGWQSIGGKWYYFNASGAMTTGWQEIGDVWYYMNSSGAMVTGWLKLGNTWYYMNASGAMVTGRQQIDGTWYIFSSSGAMQ